MRFCLDGGWDTPLSFSLEEASGFRDHSANAMEMLARDEIFFNFDLVLFSQASIHLLFKNLSIFHEVCRFT